MPEAVIVSTARTAIGTAFKGSLVDVDALELGTAVVAEAVRRSGHRPRADRRRRARRVALRRGRHRPLRRHRGRAGPRARRRPQPALRLRPGRGQTAAASIRAGHGPGRRRRRGALDVHLAPVDAPRARHRRLGRLDVARRHRDTAERPEHGHVHHRRVERRRQGRRDPRGDGRLGAALAPAGGRRHRRRQLRRGDLPDRGRAGATAPPRPSPSTSTPAATPAWRSWPRSSRCTPRSRASASPPATPPAPTTAPPPWSSPTAPWPRRSASSRSPSCGRGRRSACRPSDTGLAPDRRHPQGARPRRPRRSATSTCGRSTRRSPRCASPPPAILGIDEEIVNVLGSGCSLGHPIAMTGARMVISLVHELRRRGGGTGVAAMCAGGGMSTAVVLDVPAP